MQTGTSQHMQVLQPLHVIPSRSSWFESRYWRTPLVLAAMLCLLTGVWGGMVKIDSIVPLTQWNVNWMSFHGPLMVCGFLGTLIGTERFAAVRKWWALPGPVLTALGGVMLICGVLGQVAILPFVLGSVCLVVVTAVLCARHRAASLLVMTCGALSWCVGNSLWLEDWPIHRIVVWWSGFFVLTIAAERMELGRVLQPTVWQYGLFFAAMLTFAAGATLSAFVQATGERIAGAGMFGLALWLLHYDVARRTVRSRGPQRFTAVALLAGYVWLAVAGSALFAHAPLKSYGVIYDGTLHALFLGFVFGMIIAHAPIVLPAVLEVEVPVHRTFYVHLALLQVALILRIVAAIFGWYFGYRLGAMLTAIAVAVFLANTLGALLIAARKRMLSAGSGSAW